jgi:hypothetical protein
MADFHAFIMHVECDCHPKAGEARMVLFLFHALVAAHIVTGSIGAIAFWVPVIGQKGGANHARWGRIFTFRC